MFDNGFLATFDGMSGAPLPCLPPPWSASLPHCFFTQETQRLQSEPVAGINCMPYADNRRHFKVVLSGPDETAYEGNNLTAPLVLPL